MGDVFLFLKTQSFHYHSTQVRFTTPQRYPLSQVALFEQAFNQLYQPKTLYRATGCTVGKLHQGALVQGSLFDAPQHTARAIYQALDHRSDVRFGTSLWLMLPTLTVRV